MFTEKLGKVLQHCFHIYGLVSSLKTLSAEHDWVTKMEYTLLTKRKEQMQLIRVTQTLCGPTRNDTSTAKSALWVL